MSQHPISAFLLPSDVPPSVTTIRRHVLFFDDLIIPDPDDEALINVGEMNEKFPNMTVSNAGRWAAFPRTDGYVEAARYVVAESVELTKRAILRVAKPRDGRTPSVIRRLGMYHGAVSTESLVRAAVPDLDPSRTPKVPDG